VELVGDIEPPLNQHATSTTSLVLGIGLQQVQYLTRRGLACAPCYDREGKCVIQPTAVGLIPHQFGALLMDPSKKLFARLDIATKTEVAASREWSRCLDDIPLGESSDLASLGVDHFPPSDGRILAKLLDHAFCPIFGSIRRERAREQDRAHRIRRICEAFNLDDAWCIGLDGFLQNKRHGVEGS
jgi:hypothetical protein